MQPDAPTSEPLDESPAERTLWSAARERRARFTSRYEARRNEQHNRLVRPLRITFGILLIIVGVAIGWLPGPGFIIFALPGAFLLASEIRRAAIILDRVENEAVPRLRRLHARMRGGPKPEWVEEHPQFWGIDHERRRNATGDTGERRRRSDLLGREGESDRRQNRHKR